MNALCNHCGTDLGETHPQIGVCDNCSEVIEQFRKRFQIKDEDWSEVPDSVVTGIIKTDYMSI